MREEAKQLFEMVRKGIPDKEIMEKLGIQTKASLRRMYYDALVEAGKIRDIVTEKEAKKAKVTSRTLSITKRGTITLSNRLLIDNFGFKEGDKFTVSKRKDSIILIKEEAHNMTEKLGWSEKKLASSYVKLTEVSDEFKEFTERVDQKTWVAFNLMRDRRISLNKIASDLNLAMVIAESAENVRRCTIKWDSDWRKVKDCIAGKIDP